MYIACALSHIMFISYSCFYLSKDIKHYVIDPHRKNSFTRYVYIYIFVEHVEYCVDTSPFSFITIILL